MIKLLMEELKKLWKMGSDLKQPWQIVRLLHLGHQPNPITTRVDINISKSDYHGNLKQQKIHFEKGGDD